MRQFLSNRFRDFRPTGTPRGGQRTLRRAALQVEGLEDRLVMSTVTPFKFQPDFVLAPHQAGSQPALSPAFTPSGFSPAQIRTAYSINSSPVTGVGQTIAIVDAYNDPKIFSDLDVFDKQFATTSSGTSLYQQYGASSSFLTVYNQNGRALDPSSNTGISVDPTGGWEVEEALDVEWAHALAPGANIALVEANSDGNDIGGGDLYTGAVTAAQLPGVSVVSMSWGSGEWGGFLGIGGETDDDGNFAAPGGGHPGVTFLAAAGDNSYGNYPAFSPNVVAVGGTTLKLNADSTIQSETAWSTGSDSWNSSLGTGGGVSTQESEPSFQRGVQNTGMRTSPDVAFDADPKTGVAVFDSFGGSAGANGWTSIGGTSLATPCWAGLIAMANEQRISVGLPTLSSSGPAHQTQTLLYGLSRNAFHDITSGSITANGNTFKAGPGYDEVTGLGSPVADQVVDQLSDTLHLTGDHVPGYPDDTFTIGTTASGGLQVTVNSGVPEPFAPGTLRMVYLDTGAGINTVGVIALPAGVTLYLDNTTSGHKDTVNIGNNQASLSNIAGTVTVANLGGTTALAVYGTANDTGRTYTVSADQVNVSGMPGVVEYYGGSFVGGDIASGDVNALIINGSLGNNTMNVLSTAAAVPVTLNAGGGTNNVSVYSSYSAVSITGSGTNNVTLGAGGSLALLAGPVNISNTSNGTTGNGKSYVTLDDTNDTTGRNYTISSSAITVQGGPTINLSSTVAGVTINDAVGKANAYTVDSVLASDPLTINGDALDVLSGPAASQVTFNNHAHG